MCQFVWADLSTYDIQKSLSFYQSVFDWRFEDVNGYFVARKSNREIAGLYETPDFFKKIRMPHFWMSYVAVENALKTAELAAKFVDAKVELTSEFYGGDIALIRDPQGAGFTVYDGGKLNGRHINEANSLCWNELHVSDAKNVIPFYEKLFDWIFNYDAASSSYQVIAGDKQHVADIKQIPNAIKGKYEYWVCSFNVADLELTKRKILQNGGGVVTDEGHRMMVHDGSLEAFFYIQSNSEL